MTYGCASLTNGDLRPSPVVEVEVLPQLCRHGDTKSRTQISLLRNVASQALSHHPTPKRGIVKAVL